MEKFKLHYSIFTKIKTIILALFFKFSSWLSAESKNILIAPIFFFFFYLILFRSVTISFKRLLIFYVFLIPCYYLYFKPNFKRCSNNSTLNKKRKILNMSIKNIKSYHQFSYINQHDEIANLLIEEFVEGLINVYKDEENNKISLSTHKWILKNVLDDPRITQLFEYDTVPYKRIRNVRTEVFPLVTWSELLTFDSSIMERIHKPKVQYKITLSKKI